MTPEEFAAKAGFSTFKIRTVYYEGLQQDQRYHFRYMVPGIGECPFTLTDAALLQMTPGTSDIILVELWNKLL